VSRYFDVERGRDAEPIIRRLSIPARGELLAQSFQGNAAVRVITEIDHRLLANFARDLPVLDRVAMYPEDEFEARLVYGSTTDVLKVAEEKAEYARRLHYLNSTVDVRRSRANVSRLQELYRGRCQLCLYDPRSRFGHALCHGHHIQWLSRGGEDELENMLLICPNHHAAVHRDDAPFDYDRLAFSFSPGFAESIVLNEHLPRAV
jgi:hypothetical protein